MNALLYLMYLISVIVSVNETISSFYSKLHCSIQYTLFVINYPQSPGLTTDYCFTHSKL